MARWLLSQLLWAGLLAFGVPVYGADASGFDSDDFSSGSLNTGIWTEVDPVGDGTVSVNGSQLLLTVPGGTEHNVWVSGNDALRVMQPVNDTGFELEIKFESAVSEQFQLQGILVEQDTGRFLRFDFYHDGSDTRIFAASFVGGVPTQRVDKVISSGQPLYMRVSRVGDQWTQSFSIDRVIWNTAVTFSFALTVNSVGAFAGNAGGSAPGHTAVVDYFFSTASPISPEDGVVVPDSAAPFIRDVKKNAGLDQFQVTWATDEPATGVLEYGLTPSYELGSVSHTDFRASHDLTVSGLVPGNDYHFRLRSTDANGNETVLGDAEIRVSAQPYLDIWYGPVQHFGQLGSNAQRWINVLGHVSGANPLSTLSYALNGQAAPSLNVGPDGRRLQDTGDFNTEIEHLELSPGTNTVAITATDTLGNATTETVTVNYASGNSWPLPYTADWSTASRIEEVAQVVDGTWALQSDSVRTAQLGYDRLINIGDITWENYEVTVPITVHGLNPACSLDILLDQCGQTSPSVGVLMRWQGHYPTAIQPNWDWTPMGAIGWYRWRNNFTQGTTEPGLHITGGSGGTVVSDPSKPFPVGVPYLLKVRAETVGGEYEYKVKMWAQGQAEPPQWDLEATQTPAESLGNGSVLLIAHHVDATFGDVSVVPLSSGGTAPVINQDPVDQSVEVGRTATFSVVASGTAPLSYQWRKDGVNIQGATSSTYTIAAATLADAGGYRVLVSNDAGTARSAVATLSVTEARSGIGYWDPATSVFYLKNELSGGAADAQFRFGPVGLGWIPLVGDWDDNGTDTIGYYEPAASKFYIKNANSGGVADLTFRFGPIGLGWKPLVGDWDGDGDDTVGFWDPATSQFYIKNELSGGAADAQFRFGPVGLGWIPLVGDWDGNGTDTIGYYEPATSKFYLKNSLSGGAADEVFRFGPIGLGWTPLVGNWDGDRDDTVGFWDPATSEFYIKNELGGGVADLVFRFGPIDQGWTPLVGDWGEL